MIGLNSYFAYGNRKNSYLLELSQMHYYKNIANNLALVTLVIDRVQVSGPFSCGILPALIYVG